MAEDYDIGYGKPPKETQFAKGRSGNPRGRPSGSKNLATTFHEITRELIHIKENGKDRSVSKIYAIMLQLVNKAVSGDIKAAKEILQWDQLFESMADRESMENPDTAKNEAVMKSFIQKIRTTQTETPSAGGSSTEDSSNDNSNS